MCENAGCQFVNVTADSVSVLEETSLVLVLGVFAVVSLTLACCLICSVRRALKRTEVQRYSEDD